MPEDGQFALLHFAIGPVGERPLPSGGVQFEVEGEDETKKRMSAGWWRHRPTNGSRTRIVSEPVDLGGYGGEEVTVRLVRPELASIDHLVLATDRDQDKLPDAAERNEWDLTNHGPNGVSTVTAAPDPNEWDTDNDGLADGEEVTVRPARGNWTLVPERSLSSPSRLDTDGDGVDDRTEVLEYRTVPRIADSDFDGQLDGADSNPLDPSNSARELNRGGQALVEGAVLGETGMPDGAATSGYHNETTYMLGWIGASLIPVIELVADGRDALQNTEQGEPGEATLDAIALAPFFVNDVPKVTSTVGKWVRVNPQKGDEAYRALQESGMLRHLSISDQVKIAGAARQYDTAIAKIGDDIGHPQQASAVANKLSSARSQQLVEYSEPYAYRVKQSVVGFYSNGVTRDGEFVRYMSIGQVRQFVDDIHYLSSSNIEYANVMRRFQTSRFSSTGAWSNAKGALLETRIGVQLSKQGEDVTAISKRMEVANWDDLSEAQKTEVMANMPNGVSRRDVDNVLNGGTTDLDVVANRNYIEAKNTPNSEITLFEIRDKFIRFKAMQALGKAPEGDMVLRVSQRASNNGVVDGDIHRFAQNTEGFRIGDPVSTTARES